VVADLVPTAGETLALSQSLHRVLAADCAARVSHPPLDVSSMDGYALRAADAPGPLTVQDEAAAGHPFDGVIASKQALRIFTGAAIPAGADCVAMQEDCRRDGNLVSIDTPIAPGTHIRRAGIDFHQGQVLLKAGTLMGPRQIALAAAMNLPWLPVRRRPRVAIVSSGDEITMPGEPMRAGQLPSSNGPGLAALVQANGGEAVQLGIAADNRQSLAALISAARGCDLLVTSGGASVGDYDMVQDALTDHGLALDFWKIAMRPGKPLMFGRLRHVPVLGLPGNPVAAMVCATVFLRPMLRCLLGLPPHNPLVCATLATEMAANDARQDYVRATLTRQTNGAIVAQPFGRQDSGALSGLAGADCLIVRAPHAQAAKAGDAVTILPLHGDC
jgi:molybdopterin molybdotransferase